MKKLLVLIILCCYHTASLHAQQTIVLPDVDAVSFDDSSDDIKVYTKIGPNQYTRQILQVEEKPTQDKSPNIMLIGWNINPHKDTLSRIDIDKPQQRLVDAQELHAIALDAYINKTFTIDDCGKQEHETNEPTYVLKFLRHDFATKQELIYGDGEHDDYHRTLSSNIPDTVVTWRSTQSSYFVPLILEIKGGKKIFILYREGIKYVIFPSPKGGLMYPFYKPLYPRELTKVGDKYDGAKPYEFQYFNRYSFYDVEKTETGKLRLINQLGENVLKEEYDWISGSYRFIIAKRGNRIDVFNLYLNKLNVGKAKVAREIETCMVGCIEVLNEKGAFYYDEMGQKIKKPIRRWGRIKCGTVIYWRHNILKNKGKHLVQIYTQDPGDPDIDERYWLSDLLPSDAVAFLDGGKSFSYDENNEDPKDKVYPKMLRVCRKGKFGIMVYEYDKDKSVKPEYNYESLGNRDKTILVYPPVKIVGKTIFPINNDSIIMRPDGLTYFYKDKKVGLFPRDKVPVYDEIKKVTDSFYYIVKKGTPGWLDIKTNKEY